MKRWSGSLYTCYRVCGPRGLGYILFIKLASQEIAPLAVAIFTHSRVAIAFFAIFAIFCNFCNFFAFLPFFPTFLGHEMKVFPKWKLLIVTYTSQISYDVGTGRDGHNQYSCTLTGRKKSAFKPTSSTPSLYPCKNGYTPSACSIRLRIFKFGMMLL